ncbi:hypothetical protein [Oceanobacillus jeddahense]|uniref:hypothetical protein n=1 Tax=Oceanobacillus jeddahense TaxID=1462527 RepID=UPI000A9C0075|nr:hypothetical protein [Oceanobacillus jeddahense]
MSNPFNPNQHMDFYNQQQHPRNYQQQPNMGQHSMEQQVLSAVNPVINHGMREAQHLGYPHALREAVAIAYLMGQGQDFQSAWQMVESWWRPQTPTQPGTFY